MRRVHFYDHGVNPVPLHAVLTCSRPINNMQFSEGQTTNIFDGLRLSNCLNDLMSISTTTMQIAKSLDCYSTNIDLQHLPNNPSISSIDHLLPSRSLLIPPAHSCQLPSITPAILLDTNNGLMSGDHPQDLYSSITTDFHSSAPSYDFYSSAPSYDSDHYSNMATSTILSPYKNVSYIAACSMHLSQHYKVLEQSSIDDECLGGSLIGQLCNDPLSLQPINYQNMSTDNPYDSHMAPFMNATSKDSITSSPASYAENFVLKCTMNTDNAGLRSTAEDSPRGAIPSSNVKCNAAKKKTRKRKRLHKNLEDMENQRMTHIAVERNRRKQMNQHLDVLRSMMPSSYIQRGDQASIVGATIRLVEELEQILQSLRVEKLLRRDFTHDHLALYFDGDAATNGSFGLVGEDSYAQCQSPMVKVEVKMLSISSLVVRVLVEKRPHQLLHTLSTFRLLFLKVVHLNVTTLDMAMLYSFNLEMEIKCHLQTPLEVARSIHQALDIHIRTLLEDPS